MSSSLDYLELCRLCLVKDRVSVPIFEDEGDVRQIFLKITACLPVKVSREDKLPKKICDDCVYKVELFYQFWNTTANAEKQLLQWLGEVGGLEDKPGYVTEVLDTNVMKQETSSDSRLDGSVMQVGGHQNNMDMGMMDIITMPAGSEQQFTSVPMDTGGTVQTVQVVPGPSTQTTHDQMAQSQTSHLVGEESEEENSDDGCDNEEGLPVKEENDDHGDQPLETTFVALPCDEAGPSGLQQQKISELSEMSMQQTADNDPKTGEILDDLLSSVLSFERIEDLYPQLLNDEIDTDIFNYDAEESSNFFLEPIEYNPNGPTCHLCDKVFRRNKHLRLHMSIHQTTKPYQCNLCSTTFKTVEYLNRHMNHIHGNSKKPYPCDKCDYQANSKIRLRDHVAYKHSTDFKFPCHLCDKKFKVDWVLRMHVRKWHQSGPSSCDVCGKVYPNEGALFNHQVKKHKKSDKNFPCSVCKQSLASQKSLDTHMKLHETKHTCQHCGKICKSQNNLKNHLTTHNDEKNYACPVCDSEFTLKGAQQVHMLTHLGEKPYVCDICGKKFTQRSPMMLHRRKLHPDVNQPPPPKIKIAELLEKVQHKIEHKIRKNNSD